MTGSPDIKTLWQNQTVEGTIVTLEDIRGRAAKFQRRIRSRNLGEYIAGAFGVAIFGLYVWYLPGWMMKLGSVLSIAALLLVTWQLHRRGRARGVPDGATAVGLLAFHRAELARQREALRTVWLWYIMPFVPGAALIVLGRYFQHHVSGRTPAMDHMIIVLIAIIMVLACVIIGLLNMWGAARLQNRIDELDKLRTE